LVRIIGIFSAVRARIVDAPDVGWFLVLHVSCTSFSYGLLLKLVSGCAAPQAFHHSSQNDMS